MQIISTESIIRSKNLETRLTELGLKFKISPGVVPSQMDFHAGLLHSEFLSKLICQRSISIGEVGCALAHRNAINNFLNSHQKFGIIFEDDAEIIADFNFDIIMKLLESNLPIIIAFGWVPGFAIAKNPQDLLSKAPIELITPPSCAFAYAINREAAKLMVESQKKLIDLADWPIYILNKVYFYAPRLPWITANHDPTYSTIGVRSNPIPVSTIGVLISRIRLGSSLITLMLLSKTNKLNASPKQIVHQLLIRGALHRYGVSQFTENSKANEVVPLPFKFQKMLKLLKLS